MGIREEENRSTEVEKLKQGKTERMKTILDSVVKKRILYITYGLSFSDLLQICQSLGLSILWQVTLFNFFFFFTEKNK